VTSLPDVFRAMAFNPRQPRDRAGRWKDMGGGGNLGDWPLKFRPQDISAMKDQELSDLRKVVNERIQTAELKSERLERYLELASLVEAERSARPPYIFDMPVSPPYSQQQPKRKRRFRLKL
jgi:hypothetical protein